jgi:hypothetical protein
VGGSVPLNLRLLGLWKAESLGPLRSVLSWTAGAGFLLAVACGLLLFSARAAAYAGSPIFLAKMLLLAAAVGGSLVLHLAPARSMAGSRLLSRLAASLSLACWLAVLALGRLIGYF